LAREIPRPSFLSGGREKEKLVKMQKISREKQQMKMKRNENSSWRVPAEVA
jgi:hypothetical protein